MIDRYARDVMKKIWSLENKFQKWLEVEISACEAHAEAGNIPKKAVDIIKKKAKFNLKRIQEIEEVTNHDVIAFLTSVAENVGPESRFIHLGLTSSDVADTALSLLLKESGELLLRGVDELLISIKKQSLKYKNTVMIGRTHGVHAEPMTFGLKLALWYAEMDRNRVRLKRAIETISVGKISGAVGTYANIDPKIEKKLCKKLGLKAALISNQILQRDRHAEYLSVLAIMAGSIEKFATEIRHLQRTEVGEVEEPFGKGQKGSSAMPHKKNPILCERLSGLARLIRGYSLVGFENITLWHERDISHSSTERIIFPDGIVLIDYMLDRFKYIVDEMRVYPDKMKQNLDLLGGLVYSQRLLLLLVDKGITREDAYKLVQENAFQAREEKKTFKEIVTKDKNILKYIKLKELEEIFDIKYHLKNIDSILKRVFGKSS